jgi:glycosyltransferase involved in cell wall biosynthesis
MRIAQIAPLYESCPPQLYGGTERVVSYLTEELVRLGHEVTLFASGDSQTKAKLVPGSKKALRLDPNVVDPLAYHMIMMGRVLQEAEQFDILHFHTDYLHYPTFATGPHPIVTTLHGRQDLPDLIPVYREFSDTPLVSISDHQRKPIPRAHWVKTIHHGLPKDLLPYGPGDGGYLAFIGRISPEKRLDRAIEMAAAAGIPLKVAAKVDKADKQYFHDVIEPLLTDGVEFIGEINEFQKREFLGRARGLLFPIDWPEPFGLVMIEAMSCGTPVLAFDCGSVPEVIENGVTGIVVDSMDAAHKALPEVLKLDRRRVRAEFDKRFSAERMARDYVELYENLTRPAVPVRKPVVATGAGELYPALDIAAAARAAAAV